MFSTACAFTVLCLVSSSLATPESCDMVTRQPKRKELPPLYGEWAAVAFTMRVNHRNTMVTQMSQSFTLHYNNHTFLTTKRQFGACINQPWKASLRGVSFNRTLRSRDPVQGRPGSTTFKGTFYHTSCPDCVLMTFDIASPTYNVETLALYSKRRYITDAELDEFNVLASCLDFPEGVMMDPNMPLCPVTIEGFYT